MRNVALTLLTASLLMAGPARAKGNEGEQLAAAIATLRNVQPQKSDDENDAVNERLNRAWKYLDAHRAPAVVALQAELDKALAANPVDQFFVLDVAHFLYRADAKANGDVALRALERLDPAAPVIQANTKELFDFARLFTLHKDRRALPAIDKLFLDTDFEVFVQQHHMTLDGIWICVFLYGPFGADIDQHLVAAAKANAKREARVLDLMSAIASDAGVPFAVAELQGPGMKDAEMFGRAVGALARLGGPEGRKVLLSIDTKLLGENSKRDYLEFKPKIESLSFANLRDALVEEYGTEKLSEAQVRARLATMIAHGSLEGSPRPDAIVSAKIPLPELIQKVRALRSSLLEHVSDETLDDLNSVDRILATLSFRSY
jgi:hypothetical protein